MHVRVIIMAAALLIAMPAVAADALRDLAKAAGIRFGAAVNVEALNADAAYAQLLAREFNLVTPENAMKFSVVHPERERYDFTQTDTLVDFAEAHAMQVNGHVLVWHQQLPDWLTQGQFSQDELKAILREHIQTLVTRYRGRVASWDVAAEAIGEAGQPRDTFWSRGLGPDYLALAFRWAHEADPQAHLRYNDYGGEGAGAKADGIYRLVADLRRQEVPIHGVGLQMHVSPNDAPPTKDLRANLKRLAPLGLATHMSEMDVMLPLPASPANLKKQAVLYRDTLKACLAQPQCKSFSTWGTTDRYSWIPEYFPDQGAALLFGEDGQPKPAYDSVRRVLHGARAVKR